MLRADAYSFYYLLKTCPRVGGGLKEFNANLLRGVYEETGNVASSMLTTMLLLLN